ncbi:hypothetical protein ACLI4Z_11685 [Natrialbaceae archaeon A-arb3/5]
MRRGDSHTVSAGPNQSRARGQTTQDFVVGIGIFILAVAFVFTTVPSFVDIQSGDVDSGDSAQVERVASAILDNETVATNTPNELDGEAFNETYVQSDINDEALGLRATDEQRFDRVNVTVESINRSKEEPVNLSGGEPLVSGDPYRDQSAVTATRIVTVTDIEEDEEYAIYDGAPVRLVVRMW